MQGELRSSGTDVNDLDQALETVQVPRVAGIEGQIVTQGRSGDHEVNSPGTAGFAPGA